MKTKKLIYVAGASLILLFAACQKEVPGPAGNTADPSGSSAFTVKMTDSPGDYAALNVEITGVDAMLENGSWINLSSETKYLNVLSLTNGLETQLATSMKADAGVYSKIKITFGDEHTLTMSSSASAGGISAGGSSTVNLTWDGPKEIIVDIHEEISASGSAEVLLDFNVAQSIKEQLNEYVIKPVMTVIEDAKTGIEGKVEGAATAAVFVSDGVNTFSTYINASGEFLLRGLDDGVYDMIIMPGGDGLDKPLSGEHTLEGIIVADGKITNVGTISL